MILRLNLPFYTNIPQVYTDAQGQLTLNELAWIDDPYARRKAK